MKTQFRSFNKFALTWLIMSFLAMPQFYNNSLAQEFHGKENPPSYKEGNNALKEFVNNNLVIPDIVKDKGISGIVTVKLVIDESGSVEDVKLMRGINELCDQEALRVANLLKDWNPASNWKKHIRCNVLLPFEFGGENMGSNDRQITVSGVVTDKYEGKPVEGAIVLLKGTNIGTITDQNGKYELEIPVENQGLEIISMGYEEKTELVGRNCTINIELNSSYYTVSY